MAEVKRNAVLPKGEENGLNEIAQSLSSDMRRVRAIIGIVDCRRVTTDADTGETAATVRFRRVEVLLSDDLGAAEKLLRRALEARSGDAVLPLELEDEITKAFGEIKDPDSPVDPENPEDPGNQPPPGGKPPRGRK